MPDLTSQAATFRGGRYSFTGFLGILPQTVVFARAVNQTIADTDYPLLSLTYDDPDTDTGAFGDVTAGMLVKVYDQATATVKGYLRVADGAASSTVLQVNEFSKGTLDIVDNDRFEVLDSFLLFDKLVAATADFEKDSRITYTDQTDNYPPVANGGGAWFGWVDAGAAVATVLFDWTTSYAVDPSNVSGLTYLYADGDGTITVGTTTSSTNTTTFPVGFRHVQLTVTDADNAQSMTKQIPVYVFDDDNPPLAVQMDSMSADVQNGWRATFRLPKGSEADISTLPDGAPIWYFERERYAATEVSYGDNTPTDRAHVKMCGYLVRDSISITPEGDEVTFEAVGPLAILEQLGALPQLMVSDVSPARWSELKTLIVRRALWYLIYWHSTALEYFDFLWPDIQSTFAYTRLAIEDTSSIAGQMRDLAGSLNLDVTCDRVGRIALKENPNYLSVSDRGSVTTTYNLTTADLLSADIDREHRLTAKQVEADGITTGDDPVFSHAVAAPGEGPGVESLSRQIVANQAELNQRCGDHFALVNGTYYNETSLAVTNVPRSVRLLLPDGYDVFDPAQREFVTLTLASSTNGRGIAFTTSTKWTIESVNVNYDPDRGTKDVELTLNHETHGAAGVTYVPPQESANNLPSFPGFDLQFPDFGDFTFEVAAFDQGLSVGVADIAIFSTDGYVYFTADFNTPSASGGPTWWRTDLTGLATPLVSTLQSFVVDAFSPGYTGTANGAINGWIATNTNIYRVTDIFSTGAGIALTDLHTFATTADLKQRFIDASFGFENKVVVASLHGGATSQMDWAYSTDGSTFTEVTITSVGGDNASGLPLWSGLHISSKVSGLCYTNGYVSASGESWIYKSTDWGATWAIVTPNIDTHGGIAGGPSAIYTGNATVHVPFNDNAGDTLLWAAGVTGNGAYNASQHLYVATIGSTSETDITPTISAERYAPTNWQRSLASLGSNRQRMAFISVRSNGTGVSHLWTTTTGGETKVSWTDAGALDDLHSLALTGDPNSGVIYLWGRDGAISYTGDFGATIDDRMGNVSTFLPGLFVNICGRGA